VVRSRHKVPLWVVLDSSCSRGNAEETWPLSRTVLFLESRDVLRADNSGAIRMIILCTLYDGPDCCWFGGVTPRSCCGALSFSYTAAIAA
jgi:hypothetical protein